MQNVKLVHLCCTRVLYWTELRKCLFLLLCCYIVLVGLVIDPL